MKRHRRIHRKRDRHPFMTTSSSAEAVVSIPAARGSCLNAAGVGNFQKLLRLQVIYFTIRLHGAVYNSLCETTAEGAPMAMCFQCGGRGSTVPRSSL